MISKRKECVVCAGSLCHIKTFEKFPVYTGVDSEFGETPHRDMSWGSCSLCGCVQLLGLIDLDILYARHHNPAIGPSWSKHHDSLAKFILENMGGFRILEVGGANLKLANIVCRQNPNVSYSVIDYSCGKYETMPISDKIIQVKSSLAECKFDEKFDLIIHSHTLEHAYNPVTFLKSLGDMLSKDGLMIMSIPNIREQLKAGHMNALNFEHTYYIDDEYLSIMLARSAFSVKKIEKYSNYNNFYLCTAAPIEEKLIASHGKKKESENVFRHFVDSIHEDVEKINKRIGKDKFYSFGAHIFNQYLISSGLKKENIIAVLDNDPNKIGKKLAGTNIPVVSPSELNGISSPLVLLRAAQFNSEIKKQIKNINNTVELL